MKFDFEVFWDKFQELKPYQQCNERRNSVISHMKELSNQHINCQSCIGRCCTFEFNSMQVTPMEAIELYGYLKREGKWDSALLEKNIQDFRLDKYLSSGSKSLRRYYTCPFYNQGAKGCSISRKSKPLGCLAYNPNEMNVSAEGKCTSNTELLENTINDHQKMIDFCNEFIAKELNLFWKKETIAVALLDLDRIFHP